MYVLGDALLLNLVFGLCLAGYGAEQLGFMSRYWWLMTLINFAGIASAIVVRLYSIYRFTSGLRIVSKVLRFLLLHVLLVEASIGMTSAFPEVQGQLLNAYLLLLVLMPVWRGISLYTYRFGLRKGIHPRHVVIVGAGPASYELRDTFAQNPEYGYVFEGFFDDNPSTAENWLGRINDVKSYARNYRIDEMYCAMASLSDSQIDELMDFAESQLISIRFLPQAKQVHRFKKFRIDYYRACPVMSIKSNPLDDATNQLLKRTFDIVFSLGVITLILSWLVPLVALAIRLDSPGPIFYRQRRSGINNRVFWCLKFRTMQRDAGRTFKQATRNDPRVTRIGRLLRRTSIDELPQFFNALVGDMSIIGPRPHAVETDGQYRELIHKYHYRLAVKPGITGLSQVKGYRGETRDPDEMRQRVKLDIFYLENWSFYFDLRITLLTVFNMIRGERNAY